MPIPTGCECLQYARQQQKRQDEDERAQLDRNFDGVRALLFTEENTDAGFGIWDAGMRLSATIVTGGRMFFPTAGSTTLGPDNPSDYD